jgi:hypothetical protein
MTISWEMIMRLMTEVREGMQWDTFGTLFV